VLNDHEQRVLEDLERCYVLPAEEPVRPGRAIGRSPGRSNPPPGPRVILACASVALVLVSIFAPTAGLALTLATAIGWLFWRVWSHREDDVLCAPLSIRGQNGSNRRPCESIRRYLRWLAEAE
jgi:hypothetical protein